MSSNSIALPSAHQRLRVGEIGHAVRGGDGGQRLVDHGHFLRHADHGQRQLARAVQDAKGRALTTHLTRRDGADHPQMDAPGQCPARDRPQAEIVEGAGLVDMKPALRLLACLDRQRRGQSLALAPAGRKRLDRPDVGHGVDQLATGKIGLLRPGTVQGPAPCTVVPHRGDQPRHQDQQHHRHPPVDGEKQDQGPQEIDTRWQDSPGNDLQQRADTLGGCRDPAAQGAGQLVGEEAQSMAGEVFEEVEADVDAGGDHAVGGEQTPEPPEHAFQADQRDEQCERPPHPVRYRRRVPPWRRPAGACRTGRRWRSSPRRPSGRAGRQTTSDGAGHGAG